MSDASPPPADRVCVVCGASLAGARRHALVCGGPCRADRSRLLRILGGLPADGARSVAELHERRRKRTAASERGQAPAPDAAGTG